MTYRTGQENFWVGQFGNEYIKRNKEDKQLASNINLFSDAFNHIEKPDSLIEFGANIGMNLKAIKLLLPSIELFGIEINEIASNELVKLIERHNVFVGSIFDYIPEKKYNIVLTKGVLIHINPDKLPDVYDKIYDSSDKYILLCEYYNPTPMTINYRGHSNCLFKRDFAGEMLEKYPNSLSLVDYGFCYRRDNNFPQDDLTWFILKKGVKK